ncbi:MAG: ATP-grasp domain-containing protein [Campylobacterales bacterium]|nr:ATP-grasp domain-containing protein [Campylobacterales bacterium]
MHSAVLVTSIGSKHALLRVLKKAMYDFNPSLLLIGADINSDVVTKSSVDIFWHMPRLDELTFQELLNYVQENNISYIIPTRDAELLFFSKYKTSLLNYGVHTFVADVEVVNFCYDKLHFYTQRKIDWAIQTSTTLENIQTENIVLKERFGAGAKDIKCNVTKTETLTFADSLQNPIFQPYISGDEYSIDCYVDKHMQCRAVVVRSRDVVVNGESQISTTKEIPELKQQAAAFVELHRIQGHSLLQVILNEKGSHLIECNARFGGASSLSEYVGLRSFYWFFLESVGKKFLVTLQKHSIQQRRLSKEDTYHEC